MKPEMFILVEMRWDDIERIRFVVGKSKVSEILQNSTEYALIYRIEDDGECTLVPESLFE